MVLVIVSLKAGTGIAWKWSIRTLACRVAFLPRPPSLPAPTCLQNRSSTLSHRKCSHLQTPRCLPIPDHVSSRLKIRVRPARTGSAARRRLAGGGSVLASCASRAQRGLHRLGEAGGRPGIVRRGASRGGRERAFVHPDVETEVRARGQGQSLPPHQAWRDRTDRAALQGERGPRGRCPYNPFVHAGLAQQSQAVRAEVPGMRFVLPRVWNPEATGINRTWTGRRSAVLSTRGHVGCRCNVGDFTRRVGDLHRAARGQR